MYSTIRLTASNASWLRYSVMSLSESNRTWSQSALVNYVIEQFRKQCAETDGKAFDGAHLYLPSYQWQIKEDNNNGSRVEVGEDRQAVVSDSGVSTRSQRRKAK